MARGHLVVVLPGIGGTMLAVPDARGRPTDDVVWSASLRDARLLRDPDALSTRVHERLVPVGLIPTRKAFGIWTVVPGYDGLLKTLQKRRGAAGDDGAVVAVGYDFRLGVAAAAEHLDRQLQPRLAGRWPDERERQRRVVFVAHSMGGLVARYWAAVLGGAPYCRAIITLGTPHRGAPKALDVMPNGVRVGPLPVRLRPSMALAREWQGMADLLPRYPAVADLTSTGSLGPDAGAPRRLRPRELPLEWLTGPANGAEAMHAAIEQGWAGLHTPPAVIPRIGFGHATVRECTWDGTRIRVTRDMPAGDDVGGWAHDLGDGTVPSYCGLPVEMDNYPREWLRVHRRHGPIAHLATVTGMLDALDSDAPLTAFRDAPDAGVGLGLDLKEVHAPGTPIPIAVRPVSVDGRDVHDPAAAVWASAAAIPDPDADTAAQTGHRPVPVRLEWDEATAAFRGVLPAQPPGLVEVTVQARSLTDQAVLVRVPFLEFFPSRPAGSACLARRPRACRRVGPLPRHDLGAHRGRRRATASG